MAPVLTINGTDVTALIRTGDGFNDPTMEFRRNQRGRFTFDIEAEPEEDDEVIWYGKDGVTPMLGGLVERVAPVEVPVDADYCARTEVVDFSKYYEYGYWTKQYTVDKTVEQVLLDLEADKLSLWGISIHPGQITGVTIVAPFGWTRVLVAQVIVDLCGTRYLPITSPTKTLRLVEPGTDPAPVDLDGETCSRLTWANNTFRKANAVIGVFGASVTAADPVTHSWTTDGIATDFDIADDNIPSSSVSPNVVVVDGTSYPLWPLGHGFGLPDGITWDYSTANGRLTFNGASASLVATPGLSITVDYNQQFPFEVTATSGASPQKEIVLDFPNIRHWPQAVQAAEDALDQLDQTGGKMFEGDTLEDGIEVGQLITIDVPGRKAVEVDAVVTGVRGIIRNDLLWEYTIEADSSEVLPPDTLTDLKQQIGSSSGGAGLSIATSTPAASRALGFFLGGSNTSPVVLSSSTWKPISGAVRLPKQPTALSVLVAADAFTRDAGVSFRLRIQDVTDNTTAFESAAITPGHDRSAPLEIEVSCALAAGKQYRMEIIGDDTPDDGKEAYVLPATLASV